MSEPTRAGRPGDSQPMPIVRNDTVDIQSHVIADIMARRELGIERYGDALRADNGRDAILDAYEEALDLAMYLKQALVEDHRGGMFWLAAWSDELVTIIRDLDPERGNERIDDAVERANAQYEEYLNG